MWKNVTFQSGDQHQWLNLWKIGSDHLGISKELKWSFERSDGIGVFVDVQNRPYDLLPCLQSSPESFFAEMNKILSDAGLDVKSQELFPIKELLSWTLLKYRNSFWAELAPRWIPHLKDLLYQKQLIGESLQLWKNKGVRDALKEARKDTTQAPST